MSDGATNEQTDREFPPEETEEQKKEPETEPAGVERDDDKTLAEDGEYGVVLVDVSAGAGQELHDDDLPSETEEAVTAERDSPRKESIRNRLRREGRERARSQYYESEPQLPKVGSSRVIKKPSLVSDIHILSRDDCPASYSSDTPKETKLFQQTQRFLLQYTHLYPDRKPPFLNPFNDCRLPKCASTFIRPSLLPYLDCYDWQGCARFVADHLEYRPLKQPTETPEGMMSPATVLRYQTANCFEMSTVLCSLLTGAGYRAYVVSGYAVRAVCLSDTTRVVCPDMMHKDEEKMAKLTTNGNKYQLRPQKELVSKYEEMMAERVREAEQSQHREKLQRELKEMNEREKEPPDPLFGMRVHAWVLVLPGERDTAEAFVIEPSTGMGKGIRCGDYLGIESLWNQTNYWINLQSCINGVRDLEYDLFNPAHWEFLLLRDAMRTPHPDELESDLEEAVLDADRLTEMPLSWVERLRVSRERYDERFPCGRKVTHFYRSKLEQFSSYSMKDGIVRRLTVYSDFSCDTVLTITETYQHRADRLIRREITPATGWIEDKFERGRDDALHEHHYEVLGHNPEDSRVMRYFPGARTDCLVARIGPRRQTLPTRHRGRRHPEEIWTGRHHTQAIG